MSDGAQEASHDTLRHVICVKTWTRALSDSQDQARIAEQYTRHLDQLQSGDNSAKRSVDFLAVCRATTTTDFRWFSSASGIPSKEISKYTLVRRSEFAQQLEESENVFGLGHLAEFHDSTALIGRSASRADMSIVGQRPLQVNGHKSTAPHQSQNSLETMPDFRIRAFRNLLQPTGSDQESSYESIQASTPRAVPKRRLPQSESPSAAVESARSCSASSLSSSSSPPTVQTKTRLAQQEVKRIKLSNGNTGRKPLRLQATTSALPNEPSVYHVAVPAPKKGKPAVRPITRKIPANAMNPNVPQMQSLGNAISHARRLQAFGGSWPLKVKSTGCDDFRNSEAVREVGDITEIIEDYTVQLDASSPSSEGGSEQLRHAITPIRQGSISPGLHPVTDMNSNGASYLNDLRSLAYPAYQADDSALTVSADCTTSISATNAPLDFKELSAVHQGATASTFEQDPQHSTGSLIRSINPPNPSPQPVTSGSVGPSPGSSVCRNHSQEASNGSLLLTPPCGQYHSYRAEVPEISVTLPTSSLGSSSHNASPQSMTQGQAVTDDNDGSPVVAGQPQIGTLAKEVVMVQFLTLALGIDAAASSPQYNSRHLLPSRCIPAFRTLSKPIPASPISESIVADASLHDGGVFGSGYLGRGRRGFWHIPLDTKQPLHPRASGGVVLGLSRTLPTIDLSIVHPPVVVWTLQRVRYLLARVRDLARLGKFGVVTIATSGDGGARGIQVSCQASMALMLRTVFGELRCPVDADGNEVCDVSQDSGDGASHSQQGSNWLSAENGVRLVWWDEIERRPVLIS